MERLRDADRRGLILTLLTPLIPSFRGMVSSLNGDKSSGFGAAAAGTCALGQPRWRHLSEGFIEAHSDAAG
jgi:hypothetical protein